MVAFGFDIIYNATDIINFAQGEFVMLGGVITVSLRAAHLPMPIAFVLAVLLATIIGMIFERLAIHPLKNASVITLIIITIGASIFIRGVAMLIWGKNALPLPPFSSDEPIRLGGATILPQSLWVLGISVIVVLALRFFFDHTIWGKAMRACAMNKRAARLVGISVPRMVLLSFALSAALGAIAGIIIAPISFTGYDVGMMLGLKGFCAAIIGGLGNSLGAVVGGIVLGILESLGAGLISSGYKDAIAFLILLVVLFIKPSGIMGRG